MKQVHSTVALLHPVPYKHWYTDQGDQVAEVTQSHMTVGEVQGERKQ